MEKYCSRCGARGHTERVITQKGWRDVCIDRMWCDRRRASREVVSAKLLRNRNRYVL